ncbi:MAG TPA: glycine cleavage system aminomethyltransferase GcvT [Anaerohalosphaeraceae bacterium]|jgi:aminomethyltransferase|nr:glycine cleavage system aminomethyltransferase GcvT [Anaerohalosphaeraceae bacterium]HRT49648.1 glycine cleavage system aminomethyltransferase GcvT [Anaerohalosphaeraceae bacterium]HRT85965.1 glycine cleavage system aminomethyltransferase GcvT [Anaerohalosphaeraceae bacterium]
MDNEMAVSRKTVLFDRHVAAGGRMVDFAGWRMPVQYQHGIVAEHLWTRKHASVFDVSHMGRLVIRGPDALAFLQRVLTNDAAKLAVGESQYTIIANEAGGAVDDAYLYRFTEGEYLLVVNAANKEKDWEHLQSHLAGFKGVEMTDVSEPLAMIALQGPRSEEVLAAFLGLDVPPGGRNALFTLTARGIDFQIGRTGYTGEPVCFELMFPSRAACDIWDALAANGARPAGLGARDTLRLEAGLPLYGHEYGIDPQGRQMPIFACPLARFGVSLDENKGDFVGRRALALQYDALKRLDAGDASGLDVLPRRIRQIAILGGGIARQGATVLKDGRPAGVITSGTMAPYWKTIDKCEHVELTEESAMRAVALGLINSRIGVGELVDIDIRGKAVAAKVVRRNLDSGKGRFAVPILYSE